MKNLMLLLVILFSVSVLNAQKNKKVESDTTKLKIGGKTIIIIDKNDSNNESLEIKEIEEEEEVIVKKKDHYRSRSYSRWAGLSIGFNQLTLLENIGPLDNNTDIWEINPWKSRTWNFNLLEFNVSLVKRHILLTTGLGFEYRNYSFKKNIDLVNQADESNSPIINSVLDYDKNKLHASYVQIPVLLEINTSPRAKKGLYLATGLIGGYKMNSYMKQEYKYNGQEIEKKIDDDFNLNPYQLEGTFRIGFNRFMIYTNFDLLPVFEEGKSTTGDQITNVTFGVQLIGF